jgi:hypothetical protein
LDKVPKDGDTDAVVTDDVNDIDTVLTDEEIDIDTVLTDGEILGVIEIETVLMEFDV